MQQVVIEQYGSADLLKPIEAPKPRPSAGQIVVRQTFAGVNYADIYMRKGYYRGEHTYGTELPLAVGLEGAGTVESVGKDVERLREGDRVAYCLVKGAYAEYVAVDAEKAVLVPDGYRDEVILSLLLQGATAHYLSHTLFSVGAGQTALVHAAAGGVGRILVQICKARGAGVIATAGSQEKVEAVSRLGADFVVNYRNEDFAQRVKEITDGEGVDVVYDSVGRDTVHGSMGCLRARGMLVLFGASSGPVDSIVPMALAEAGSVFFTRPHLAHYRRNRAEAQLQLDDILSYVRRGQLKTEIDSVFSLIDARDAHLRAETRQSQGKILLKTG